MWDGRQEGSEAGEGEGVEQKKADVMARKDLGDQETIL